MDRLAEALGGYTHGASAAAAASAPLPSPASRTSAGSARASEAGFGDGVLGGGGGGAWRGVGFVRVDGSHDSRERQAAVQRFRSDPSVRVALLSITAAAVGARAAPESGRVPAMRPAHHCSAPGRLCS
jgi:hypothetical protein